MKSSESIANLADALVRANLVVTNPTKDKSAKVKMKQGGEYTYRYAALDSILADMRPILQAHGLAVVQEARSAEQAVGVVTRLLHSSGEWLEYDPLWLPMGGDAQSAGSAITYARRYALCAALGIAADEDDDGAKAKKSPAAHGATKTGETTPRSNAVPTTPVAGDTPSVAEPSSTTEGTTSDEVGGAGAVQGDTEPASSDLSQEQPEAHTGDKPSSTTSTAVPEQPKHAHQWADSPKLSKYVVCTVEGCLATERKSAVNA